MVLEMSFKVIEQYSYLDQTILEHFSLTTLMNPINRASRMNILVNSGIDLLFESRQKVIPRRCLILRLVRDPNRCSGHIIWKMFFSISTPNCLLYGSKYGKFQRSVKVFPMCLKTDLLH